MFSLFRTVFVLRLFSVLLVPLPVRVAFPGVTLLLSREAELSLWDTPLLTSSLRPELERMVTDPKSERRCVL